MITTSVSEARRRLSQLIDLARQGQQVVIIKDSRPVASIYAIDDADLELATTITDSQARRLHAWIDAQPKVALPNARAAVKFLQKDASRRGSRKRR